MHQTTFNLTADQHPAELRFGIGFDYESRAALLALVMGKHSRLGANSWISNIPDEVLMVILPRSQCVSVDIPAWNLSLYDLKAGSQRGDRPHFWRVPDSLLAQHLYTELCTRKDPLTAGLHKDPEYGRTLTLHKAGGVGTMRLHFAGLATLVPVP